MLRDRLEAGMSMVLVTHNLTQARRMAGRLLRLESGRITEANP